MSNGNLKDFNTNKGPVIVYRQWGGLVQVGGGHVPILLTLPILKHFVTERPLPLIIQNVCIIYVVSAQTSLILTLAAPAPPTRIPKK